MSYTFHEGARRIRAKVYVREVARKQTGYQGSNGTGQNKPQEYVQFAFVAGNDPDGENAKFFDATPPGEPWTMIIQNPGAQGTFEPGQEWYLDFVESVREEVPE